MKIDWVGKRSLGVILLGLLLTGTETTRAIDGLQLSLQCSNVVLSWPSGGGHNYIVQYRQTLSATDSWQTLTSAWPDSGTNITVFVHSNIVQNPSCGCGGGSSPLVAMSAGSMATAASAPIQQTEPLVIPADGSGGAVPLALYPPGFDLTGFLIYDPITGESVSGAGYSNQALSPLAASASSSGGGLTPSPNGGTGGSGGGGVVGSPETGFYEVVQDGVGIWGSTLTAFNSGPVSNTVTIPFETGNADPNNSTNLLGTLYDVYVMVDGAPYRGATPLVAPEVGNSIGLDTSFLENGDHTVQVVASWTNPDLTDPNFQYFTRYSDPFTLSVSNIIYYPDWEDEISELGFAYYSFETTCTNANWQINIYDVSNQLVQTLSGYTTNGFVETNWNLVDLNGVTRTNDNEFSSVITVGDPVTRATPGHRRPLPYPSQGEWAITYQDMFGDMLNSNVEYAAHYQFGSLAAQNGGGYTVTPTPGHPEYGQTWPLRFPYPNDPTPPTGLQEIADENALINLLTNNAIRNFYYGGHSSATSIASVDDIRFSIALARHYYRFVFINGCSSAAGDLPQAFGIKMNSQQSISYFQTHGIRPRTFLGYSQDVTFANSGDFIDPTTGLHCYASIPSRVTDFLNNFEFYWDFNYDITTAIYNAENDTPDLRSGWADGPNLNLFGYSSMHINDYNYQTDWSN